MCRSVVTTFRSPDEPELARTHKQFLPVASGTVLNTKVLVVWYGTIGYGYLRLTKMINKNGTVSNYCSTTRHKVSGYSTFKWHQFK